MSRFGPGFRIVQVFDSPVIGSREAVWGQADVHVKFEDPNCPGTLWRELVASRLASACGLPVPPGDLATASGNRRAWVTAKVAIDGQEPPPPDPTVVVSDEPELAAGVFVFDCWLANLDRSDENLMFGPRIGLWLIDHEHAFAARQPPELPHQDGTADENHVFASFQFESALLDRWSSQLQALSKRSMTGAVQEAVTRRLLSATDRDVVVAWLDSRRHRLRDLVKQCHLPSSTQDVSGERDDLASGGGLWAI